MIMCVHFEGVSPVVEELRGPSEPIVGCDFGVTQHW
jgi:hypothetical protein